MMGMGKAMMQRLMKDINFPQVDELIKLAKELDVKFIACTTTMGMMGITRDAFIPEVDTFAGVATYIAEARESKISLFI
jgi:peroxiredoxin family protein